MSDFTVFDGNGAPKMSHMLLDKAKLGMRLHSEFFIKYF